MILVVFAASGISAKTKVMITGHKGYVGKALVEAMKSDYDIVGYSKVCITISKCRRLVNTRYRSVISHK